MNFEEQLFHNPYPGRTLIIGMTPSGSHYVQVYWIMGRSANSRNRVFELDELHVRTAAYDPDQLEDPSLIIYYPIRDYNGIHIITNGDQTETIVEGFKKGVPFAESLMTREFEPDAPLYTPRISGITDTLSEMYALSILKSDLNDPSICVRNYFYYSAFRKGRGHCIHTYTAEERGIMKSFMGEPFEVPLFDTIHENAEFYWNRLNEENKVSLLVKYISVKENWIQYKIINKNK